MWPKQIPQINEWKSPPTPILYPEPEEYYCTTPTFGADPEYFAWHKAKKRPYPPPFQAAGELNKDRRIAVEDTDGSYIGEIQQDGFAMECNLAPVEIPAQDKSRQKDVDAVAYKAADEVWHKLSVLREVMNEKLAPHDMELIPHSSVRFWKKDYNAQPESVREIGCAPDLLLSHGVIFNRSVSRHPYLVTEGINPKPTQARYAGGHMHFGWTKDWDVTDPWHIYNASIVVTWLANVLWPTLVWMEHRVREWEEKRHTLLRYKHRRMYSLYGNPFLCRVTPYGVEWRCPSNAWTQRKTFVTTVMRVVSRLFANTNSADALPPGKLRGTPYLVSVCLPGENFMNARSFFRENLITEEDQLRRMVGRDVTRNLPLYKMSRFIRER